MTLQMTLHTRPAPWTESDGALMVGSTVIRGPALCPLLVETVLATGPQ
jgi:hypothetical protein